MIWQIKPISKCLQNIPKLGSLLHSDYLKEGKFPVIDQGQDFIAGYTNNDSLIFNDCLPVIIFGDHTRALKFIDFPFAVGADGTKILKPSNEFEPKFFYYMLESIDLGSRGYARHFKLLKEQEIPLPPLAIQHKIVAILDEKFAKLREAKRLRQEAIGDTEKILVATLREIFEEGKEKGWKEKTIQDCCILKSGTTISPGLEKETGDLLYLKVGDMNMFENQIEINTSSRFCDSKDSNLKQIIPVGSIIFPKRGGAIFTNKKRIITKPTIVDLNVMAMIPRESLESKFLYYWFSMLDLKTINSGSSVPQINNVDINPLKILIPPLAEQKKIVTRLDTLSEKLRTLRELQQLQLEDMKKLEKAYLREAFRGELV